MIFAFGECELDSDLYELRRRGTACRLEPQVLDLLFHLVKNRDRLVTKNEINETIWNGRVVSESALSTRVNAARRAIGDSGSKQGYIRTVSRRGFRFMGDVDVRERPDGPDGAHAASQEFLCGSFACYSYAWSPAFEGKIIRGALIIEPPSGSPPTMTAVYSESLPNRTVSLCHRGAVAFADHIMCLDLVDPLASSRALLALLCPNPPASALLGVMCGKVFHHPNCELAVTRILAARVPLPDPAALQASNRYLDPEAESLSGDLHELGVRLSPSAALDALFEGFLKGGSGASPSRVTAAENQAVNVAIDKALAEGNRVAAAATIAREPGGHRRRLFRSL